MIPHVDGPSLRRHSREFAGRVIASSGASLVSDVLLHAQWLAVALALCGAALAVGLLWVVRDRG